MIQTPIPTDNLYKFLALSGLAAVAFCFWYPSQFDQTIAPRVLDARHRMLDYLEGKKTEILGLDSLLKKMELDFFVKMSLDATATDRDLAQKFLDFLDIMLKISWRELTRDQIKDIIDNTPSRGPNKSGLTDDQFVDVVFKAHSKLVKESKTTSP